MNIQFHLDGGECTGRVRRSHYWSPVVIRRSVWTTIEVMTTGDRLLCDSMARRSKIADEFEGYRLRDITYCIDPVTNRFFPVRVVMVERQSLVVEPLDIELSSLVSPELILESANRTFSRPKLPASSRFGGCDERVVNTNRVSGQELRLLPFHYGTYTGDEIKKLHASDPARWPLPTGTVYERWFKDK